LKESTIKVRNKEYGTWQRKAINSHRLTVAFCAVYKYSRLLTYVKQ